MEGKGVDGPTIWLQVLAGPAVEEEAAIRHSTSKLRRAIAASANVMSPPVPPPLQDVELDAAKEESVGALVRRYTGKPPTSNTPICHGLLPQSNAREYLPHQCFLLAVLQLVH